MPSLVEDINNIVGRQAVARQGSRLEVVGAPTIWATKGEEQWQEGAGRAATWR